MMISNEGFQKTNNKPRVNNCYLNCQSVSGRGRQWRVMTFYQMVCIASTATAIAVIRDLDYHKAAI